MKISAMIASYVFLTFAGPLYVLWTGQVSLTGDYRTANRKTAEIAPLADNFPDAVIQIYSARTFNWRGLFAVHTWIATKRTNAKKYTVYQKIGWRVLHDLSPVVVENDLPDRFWFAQKPQVILDIRGKKAEELITKIEAAAKKYPFMNEYSYWPGPNSNTFIAFIGREVPELNLVMPSIAVGKDYFTKGIFAPAVSGTGYQLSIDGVFGITLAMKEGLEINLLGLVYGISPQQRAIKLPGIGEIGPKANS